jgi:hypothetical protein
MDKQSYATINWDRRRDLLIISSSFYEKRGNCWHSLVMYNILIALQLGNGSDR